MIRCKKCMDICMLTLIRIGTLYSKRVCFDCVYNNVIRTKKKKQCNNYKAIGKCDL